MTDYTWLVGKTYHGCNAHPHRDVQDGRKITVLAVAVDLPGDLCFSGGDRLANENDTVRDMLTRNAADMPKALVETCDGARTWVTAAKWVADEILRQHKLGWIMLCPDCGSTETAIEYENETPVGTCYDCQIWFDLNDEQVTHDQDRQARGLPPGYPLADCLEHGPLDFVD